MGDTSNHEIWMGYREYGRHRKAQGLPGTTHVAVIQAIRTGRIPAGAVDLERKKINSSLADAAWLAQTNAAQRRQATDNVARTMAGPSAELLAVPLPPVVAAGPQSVRGELVDFMAIKAARERVNLERDQIALARER